MYIYAPTLDDLLMLVYKKLLTSKSFICPSKGPATEIAGVLLKISNPRARLSRTEIKGTLFSCLGEFLWYLSGSNRLDFVSHYIPEYKEYSDDGETIYGAYGPRLFGDGEESQFFNVIKTLKEKPDSRQAVIQIFHGDDIVEKHKDVPCTCTMQFMIRKKRLHMITTMRSNDAFLGLPHDVFAFTMLQEIMARSLGVEVGFYKHAVGSLHLYEKDKEKAEKFINEGWQEKLSMPAMPRSDPWDSIKMLLHVEGLIRGGCDKLPSLEGLDAYWRDIALIIMFFALTKDSAGLNKARNIKKQLSCSIYSTYLKKRQTKQAHKLLPPEQFNLFLNGNEEINV